MESERKPEVSVIIVSWNSAERLPACLGAVASGLAGIGHEVLVVDNNSSDGSAAMVRREFPSVKVLEKPVNSGFAAGCNAGIGESSGEYLLLLNPDALLMPGTVPALLALLRGDPRAAVAAPAFSDRADTAPSIRPWIYRFPGFKDELVENTLLEDVSRFFNRHVRSVSSGGRAAAEGAVETDWVPGACMLVRRRAAYEHGLLDEQFFLYMEELEWCYRMKKLGGWKIYILPSVGTAHAGGASTAKLDPAERVRIYYDSRYKFFEKYRSAPAVACLRGMKAFLMAVTILWYMAARLSASGSKAEAGAKIKDLWAAIPVILKIQRVGTAER